MARSKKSATKVKVNFKGVESRRTPSEGDYPCVVLEATSGKSGAGNEQIEFVGEISKGEYKGTKVYLYCPLQENSLWKLHAFLTALGVDVPEDDLDIDLSELVGEEFMGVITHETYNGKKRAKLTDFDTIDNYSGEAEDDDDDKKGKKSKKGKGADKDDAKADKKKAGKGKSKEPEKLSKSDVEDMDRDDLVELIGEHDLDVDPKSKKLKKDDDALLAAVLEALDDNDLLEAEKKADKKAKKGDDKKASKKDDKKADKKGGKKKSKKLSRSDVEDMDEDELQELIDKHDLDVDLDDHKKLPKKVAAVIDELEEADLLEDDD